MKEIREYQSADSKLHLKVKSSLLNVPADIAEVLWTVLSTAKLEGEYHLILSAKEQGLNGQTRQIKVLSLNQNNSMAVDMKMQVCSEQCYRGRLYRFGNQGHTGSNLQRALVDVVGIAWYNPDRPEEKTVRNAHVPGPLVQVAEAIPQTGRDPVDPGPGATGATKGIEVAPISEKGLAINDHRVHHSLDDEATKLVFEEAAGLADAKWFVAKGDFSNLVYQAITDAGQPQDRRVVGSTIGKWIRDGYLLRMQVDRTNSGYFITTKAIELFGLNKTGSESPEATMGVVAGEDTERVPVEVPSQCQTRLPEPLDDVGKSEYDEVSKSMLAAIKGLMDSASRVTALKSELGELQAQVTQLEDRIRGINEELQRAEADRFRLNQLQELLRPKQ